MTMRFSCLKICGRTICYLGLLSLASVLPAKSTDPGDQQSARSAIPVPQVRRHEGDCLLEFGPGAYLLESKLEFVGCHSVQILGSGSASIVEVHSQFDSKNDQIVDASGLDSFVMKGLIVYGVPKASARNKLFRIDADKIIMENNVVIGEGGRGVVTLFSKDALVQNNAFYDVGISATDSSVIHPGNRRKGASNVRILNNFNFTRSEKTTFVDAVDVEGIEIRGNTSIGGKKGVILSWPNGLMRGVVVQENAFSECLSRCIDVYQNSKRDEVYISDVTISDNHLSGKVGIRVADSNRVKNLSIDSNVFDVDSRDLRYVD